MKIHTDEDLNSHSDAEDSDSDSKLEDLVLHSVGQDLDLEEVDSLNYSIGLHVHVISFSHNAAALVSERRIEIVNIRLFF